jgi:hypothetical protein
MHTPPVSYYKTSARLNFSLSTSLWSFISLTSLSPPEFVSSASLVPRRFLVIQKITLLNVVGYTQETRERKIGGKWGKAPGRK